jgi:virginiamycin B lyase
MGARVGQQVWRGIGAVAAALAVALAAPGSAGAWLTDAGGEPIPNTDSSSPSAQLDGLPTVERLLAEPFSPEDDDAGALGALGPTGAPDDDLGAALDRMAAAQDAAEGSAARAEALAILTGAPLPGRPYSGIGLLNWDAPRKVGHVPAGGRVVVRQVRFGGHVLTDTALLEFEDPSRPFTILYEVAELGGTDGAELAPAPLLADGEPIGGQTSVLAPLGLPSFPTGTETASRFHPGGAPEATRLAVQRIAVKMPPAGLVRAVLDADDRPGREASAVLRPATAAHVAALEQRFGFSGDAPSDADRERAIGRLGATAPERQLHDALAALDPGDVDGLRRAGVDLRPLVGVMRSRTQLPPGVPTDAGADLTVVLVNDEAYVSRAALHLAPGRPLRVEVVNADGFERDPSALQLHDRMPVFGALDPGRFVWGPLALGGPLAPGGSRTVELHPADDAFALWVGDAEGGDQAGAMVRVDRGAARQTLSVAGTPDDPRPFSAPLHSAEAPDGSVWTALSGVDELLRIHPSDDLGSARTERVVLPGGANGPASAASPLAPQGIAVDGRGIVWATLPLGNAIARVDPGQISDGTPDGVRIYPLAACAPDECDVPAPPDPPVSTRLPVQMAVAEDADGNTVVWFAEQGADRIGALRVAPDGTLRTRVDFPCGCDMPLGVGVDGDGAVWFTEGIDNRIGRLTQDTSRPWAVSTVRLAHFEIPSAVLVEDPALSPEPVLTSAPHSLALDRRGRVWFSEAETSKVGVLDPAQARPNTSDGIREVQLPATDFGGESVPADLVVDRGDTAFWVDEYGDIVGSVHEEDGALRNGPRFRPAERQSLTDSPMVTDDGDLWFAEAAAAQLTRVRGVSAGRPRPARSARLAVDTDAATLHAEGLREMTSADVRVVRDGTTVGRALGLDARGGGFAVGGGAGAWDDAPTGGLRPGDRVTLTPGGPHAPAPMTVTVPELTAAAGAGGRVGGTARVGSAAVAGAVDVRVGEATARAAVDPSDATFTATLDGAGPGARGTLRWTSATPALVVETTTAFGALPPGPGPGGGENPPPAGTPPVTEMPRTPVTPPTPGPSPKQPDGTTTPAPACATAWLTRSGSRRRFAWLGRDADGLARCLGRPASRRSTRLAYRGGLEVRLRAGRATGFTIWGTRWRSAPDRARVGASTRALRAALGRLRVKGSRGRAVLALGGGRYADVRVSLRRGRVLRIAIDSRTRARLDATARRLLAEAR